MNFNINNIESESIKDIIVKIIIEIINKHI